MVKTVCVTGGNGYIASLLIKLLLERGYAVNTTVRNPDNANKIGQLKQLQSLGALKIFRGDLVEEGSFDEAVAGCTFVFLVAAPVNLMSEDPENELIKPAIQAVANVMRSCVKARTVKRVILTSSGAAISFIELEGTGHVLDEETWSDVEYLTAKKPPTWGYGVSKVLAEREAFKFAEENKISLVSINGTLALGSAPNPPSTGNALGLSLLSGNEGMINGLKMMQTVSGSISVTHVEDICRAHIFVAETESASGRYICCAANTSVPKLAKFLSERYPGYNVPTSFDDIPETPKSIFSSEKLIKAGFEFKHKNLEDIYDKVVEWGKTLGLLPKVNGACTK